MRWLSKQKETCWFSSLGRRKLIQCSVHRLAVVFARIVQYHALNWLVWINMHSVEVAASTDQVRSLGKSALSCNYEMSPWSSALAADHAAVILTSDLLNIDL